MAAARRPWSLVATSAGPSVSSRGPCARIWAELDRIWQETGRKLEAVSPLLPDADRRSLEQSLSGLFETATGDPGGVTLAHGDLSPDNLIMMNGGTGLIDFMWMPQLRGFDLSRFVHRLRYTTPSSDRWARSLTDAVLEDTGDRRRRTTGVAVLRDAVPAGDDPAPGEKGRGGRRSAGRALAEIRAGL